MLGQPLNLSEFLFPLEEQKQPELDNAQDPLMILFMYAVKYVTMLIADFPVSVLPLCPELNGR